MIAQWVAIIALFSTGYVPPGYDLVVQIRFSEWAAGLRAAIAALDPYSVVVQVGANGIQVGRNARLPQ